MILTGFVGYAICASAPVARQTAATDPAIWRSTLLKAMIPSSSLDTATALLTSSARLFFSPAADPIIATKAAARPSPAHGPMDAPVAAARWRSKMGDNARRARG